MDEKPQSPIDILTALPRNGRRVCLPGKDCFRAGEKSEHLYIIREGVVELYIDDDNAAAEEGEVTKRAKLELLSVGDVFGEAEFLGRRPDRLPYDSFDASSRNAFGTPMERLFSARALVRAELTQIRYDELWKVMATRPELIGFLQNRVVRRLESLVAFVALSRFGGRGPEARIADALKEKAALFGARAGRAGQSSQIIRFTTRITQLNIAEDVGTTRESVNQTWSEWERAGIIRAGRDSQPFILDYNRLNLIARTRRAPSRIDHDDAMAQVDTLLAAGDNFRARNVTLFFLDQFPLSAELQYRVCLASCRAGALAEARSLAMRFGFDVSLDKSLFSLRTRLRGSILHPHARRKTRNLADIEENGDLTSRADIERRLVRLLEDVATIIPLIDYELAVGSSIARVRAEALEESFNGYDTVNPTIGSVHTAISTAVVKRLAGKVEDSRSLARSVLNKIPDKPPSYRHAIAGAIAHALLEEWSEVPAATAQAVRTGDANIGVIASTRRQIAGLRDTLGSDNVENMLAHMGVAASMVYLGHTLAVGRTTPAENLAAEADLVKQIDAALTRYPIDRAYGALSCGAEIVIAERVLAAGSELHVVLPTRIPDFIRTSVTSGDHPGVFARSWLERFDSCLARARSLTILHDSPYTARQWHALVEQGLRYAAGLALLRRDELTGSARLLAVPGRGDTDGLVRVHSTRLKWHDDDAITTIASPWDAAGIAGVTSDASPFRAVVYLCADLPLSSLDRLKIAKDRSVSHLLKIKQEELELLKSFAVSVLGNDLPMENRLEGGSTHLGLVLICQTVEEALEVAKRIVSAKSDYFPSFRTVCDHGMVLDHRGGCHSDSISRLRVCVDYPDIPSGIVVTTEPFAAEARLIRIGRGHFQPMGRISTMREPGAGLSESHGMPRASHRFFRFDSSDEPPCAETAPSGEADPTMAGARQNTL